MMSPCPSATLPFERPPIIVDRAHFDRLQGLALSAMTRSPDIANELLEELDRAEVRPTALVPRHVVNLGSSVTVRYDDTGESTTVDLVFPEHADISRQRVSILTPIGIALIGLSEGAQMQWRTRTGQVRHLTVTRVVLQTTSPSNKC